MSRARYAKSADRIEGEILIIRIGPFNQQGDGAAADGYLDKKGELSFEQILFCRSLETMALCAELVGDANGKQKYEKLAAALKAKLEPAFWNNQKQAFVHNCVNGQQSDAVTRYANMLSVLFY